MNRKRASILVISIIAAISILHTIKIPVLLLTNQHNGEVLFLDRVAPSTGFDVRWMHSVELLPWEEHFIVDKDSNIVLSSTKFKAYGAGVPENGGKKTIVKDGYIHYIDINKKMPSLIYGISQFAKHTFIYKGREIPLYKIVEDGTPVWFQIKKLPMANYLFKRLYLQSISIM